MEDRTSVFDRRGYSLRRPVDSLERLRFSLRMAAQRARQGYCERDVRNMDRWLCSVLPPMLHDLRVKGHTYAPVDEADWEEAGVTADMPEAERWERLLAHAEALLRLAQGRASRRPAGTPTTPR